jgi:hypothetical protein
MQRVARSLDGAKRNPGACFAGFSRIALRSIRATKIRRSRHCECIPIPVLKASLILLASWPMSERFLEAILQRTERKLAGPGRPGPVDGLVAGGAPGGAAPSLGRARCLAARGGYVNPASRVPVGALAPPAAPPPRAVREGWQSSDALRRENAEAWLFESLNQNLKRGAFLTSPRSSRGEVGAKRRVRGQALRLPNQKTYRVGKPSAQQHDPRVCRTCLAHCLAPHPKPSRSLSSGGASRRPVGFGFDLSPQERGEVKKALRCVRGTNAETPSVYDVLNPAR